MATVKEINDLIDIDDQLQELFEAKRVLLAKLVEKYGVEEPAIYENEDGTWTRLKLIDNIQELAQNGTVWKSTSFEQYSSKVDVLKRKPKELVEKEKANA